MSNEKAQHTPAPWHLHAGEDYLMVYYETPNDNDKTIFCCDFPDTEDKASARLIAAAPDLLVALQFIAYDAVITAEEAREVVRAAIAKAKGEA